MKTPNQDFALTAFFGVSAIVMAFFCAWLLFVLIQASDATKLRHAAEHTQLVCFNDDRIATDARWTECRRVTWRPA